VDPVRRGAAPRGEVAVPAEFFVDSPAAPVPNLPRLGVAVALARGSTVLMEHRSDADLWAFVGGGVDDDESLAQAAHREVQEETGFALIGDMRLIAIYSSPGRITAYPDGNVSRLVTVAFLAECPPGVVTTSSESTHLAFVPFENLPGLLIAATHKALAAHLHANRDAPFAMDPHFD
jgi:8-oxo-dGTP pyrophosphatase MutT (NUDIX family)